MADLLYFEDLHAGSQLSCFPVLIGQKFWGSFLSVSFNEGTDFIYEDPITLSRLNHFPKTPAPDVITMVIRSQQEKLWWM